MKDQYKIAKNNAGETAKPTIQNGVITAPVVAGQGTVNGASPTDSKFVPIQSQAKQKLEQQIAHEQSQKDDLRALQQAKFSKFKSDPNARDAPEYQKPASLAAGAKEEEATWYNPFSWFGGGGGGSSSSGGGNGGYPRPANNDRPRPRIKTVGDLPKPIQRG